MNVLLIMETAHNNVSTLLEVTLAIALLVITWRLIAKPAAVSVPNKIQFMAYHFIIILIDVNLCTSKNGGCSHTCIGMNGSHVLCSCMLGYQLDSDSSTCIGKRKE